MSGVGYPSAAQLAEAVEVEVAPRAAGPGEAVDAAT